MSAATQYLTPEQVFELNEKHGWFEYGDSQSDVSKAFAQEAIEKHELMRAAAPELLAAIDHPMLRQLFGDLEDSGTPEAQKLWAYAMAWFDVRDAAIAKATGAAS